MAQPIYMEYWPNPRGEGSSFIELLQDRAYIGKLQRAAKKLA